MQYSITELMAVVLARSLRDGEVGDVGAYSEIPMAACMLARELHAPNLTWISGASGSINAPGPLVRSSGDFELARRAEAVMNFDDVTDVILRHRPRRFDFSFLGGLQIDPYGNLNLAWVGPMDSPSFYGPGSVGLPQISRIRRFFIYLHRHDTRTFVERVDFVSGFGRNVSLPGREGPVLVVTPLAVFDFSGRGGRMRLRSVHPGVELEEVVSNTGFAIETEAVTVTEPPSDRELRLMHDVIDVYGILRQVKVKGLVGG